MGNEEGFNNDKHAHMHADIEVHIYLNASFISKERIRKENLHSALRLRFWNPLDSVHAALKLQTAEDAMTGHVCRRLSHTAISVVLQILLACNIDGIK